MSSFFQFANYRDDLEACWTSLSRDLRSAGAALGATPRGSSRPLWTDLMLNWFYNARSKDVVVDTSAPTASSPNELDLALPKQFRENRLGHGETLRVDQTHWCWPKYDIAYATRRYWKTALAHPKPLECLLALECEWTGKTDENRYCEVMHEAAKLLTLNARVKVIVFASNFTRRDELRDELFRDIETLRDRGGDAKPWLLIDVPHGDWAKSHAPDAKILRDGAT